MASGSFISPWTGDGTSQASAYRGTIINDYTLTAYEQTSLGNAPTAQLCVTVTCTAEVLAAIQADGKYNGPSAPANPAASALPEGIQISWDAVVDAVSYKIYRGTTTGQEYQAVQTGQTTIPWTDTSVTSGTTYYYKVTAVNASGGESVKSSEVSAVAL